MRIKHIGPPRIVGISDSEVLRRESINTVMREVGEALLPPGDWYYYDAEGVNERPFQRASRPTDTRDSFDLRALHLQLWSHGARASRIWMAWCQKFAGADALRGRYAEYQKASGPSGTLNQYLMNGGQLWPFALDATDVSIAEHSVGHRSPGDTKTDAEMIGAQIADAEGTHGYTLFFPHHQTPGALVLFSRGEISSEELLGWQAAGAHAFAKLCHRGDLDLVCELLDTLGIRLGLDTPSSSRLYPLLRYISAARELSHTQESGKLSVAEWQDLLKQAAMDAIAVTSGKRFAILREGIPEPRRQKIVTGTAHQLFTQIDQADTFPTVDKKLRGMVQTVLEEALRNAFRYHGGTTPIEIYADSKSVQLTNKPHPQVALWPHTFSRVDEIEECKVASPGAAPDPLASLEHGGVGITIFLQADRIFRENGFEIGLGPRENAVYQFTLRVAARKSDAESNPSKR